MTDEPVLTGSEETPSAPNTHLNAPNVSLKKRRSVVLSVGGTFIAACLLLALLAPFLRTSHVRKENAPATSASLELILTKAFVGEVPSAQQYDETKADPIPDQHLAVSVLYSSCASYIYRDDSVLVSLIDSTSTASAQRQRILNLLGRVIAGVIKRDEPGAINAYSFTLLCAADHTSDSHIMAYVSIDEDTVRGLREQFRSNSLSPTSSIVGSIEKQNLGQKCQIEWRGLLND